MADHRRRQGPRGAAARARFVLVAAGLFCVPLSPGGFAQADDEPVAGKETIVAADPSIRTGSMNVRTYDGNGNRLEDTVWRTAKGTGNCCEHYLAVAPTGRVYDLGGGSLYYTDDRGQTWNEVEPALHGGEGAVAVAPNGDAAGITWNWSADALVTYKYDAARDKWFTSLVPVHTPGFDRPWLALIPGPFAISTPSGEAVRAPYMTIATGGLMVPPIAPLQQTTLDGPGGRGTFGDDLYFLPEISFDALNYLPYYRYLDQQDPEVRHWSPPAPDPGADWTQPHARAAITPLPGGGAITYTRECGWMITTDGGRWACTDAAISPGGPLVFDSRARAHQLRHPRPGSMEYALSADGGGTWRVTPLPLPAGIGAPLNRWDFKANAGVGVAVVTAVARDITTGNDQVIAFKLDIDGDVATVDRVYLLGAGDTKLGAGSGASWPRFDFSSVGILPDGRVVASFADAAHAGPTIAMEVS